MVARGNIYIMAFFFREFLLDRNKTPWYLVMSNSCSFRTCLAEAENRVTYRYVCYPFFSTLFGWLRNADHDSNDTVVCFHLYIPLDQMIMEQAFRACSVKLRGRIRI